MRHEITTALALLLAAAAPVLAQGAAAVEEGRVLFAGAANCFACHGAEGKGTGIGPNLADAEWLNAQEGTLEAITRLIRSGVDEPVEYATPMPAMGGAQLTEAQIAALGAYVWSLSQVGAPQEQGGPEEILRAMRRNLLELASMQEIHRAGAGAYAATLAELAHEPGDGVRLVIVEAGKSGWAGSATHPELAGKSCVVFFGKAAAPRTAGGIQARRAASVVCDAVE